MFILAAATAQKACGVPDERMPTVSTIAVVHRSMWVFTAAATIVNCMTATQCHKIFEIAVATPSKLCIRQ